MRYRSAAGRLGICAALFLMAAASGCYKVPKDSASQQDPQGQQSQAPQQAQQSQQTPLPQQSQQGQQSAQQQQTQQTQQSQGSASTASGTAASPAVGSITIPSGITFKVSLGQTIASNQSHAGDGFSGTLAQPVLLEGKTVFPRGARILGRISAAQASGRLETPAFLEVTLSSIQLDGRVYKVSTSSISRKGPSHKTRNEVAIGGGAGAGAIIGALAGKGKGAIIGAGAGAAAGTAGAAATGKQDIVIPVETILSFRLARPITVGGSN